MTNALPKATLVLGIGNTLLTDDGAGVHTIFHLRRTQDEATDVRYVDGGTLSFVFMEEIEGAGALVVIDAAELNAPPGTIRRFEGRGMDEFLRAGRRSAHEVGLADILELARLRGWSLPRRALVAIQPQHLGWGDAPSPSVARAIPEAAELVVRLVEGWRHGHRSGGVIGSHKGHGTQRKPHSIDQR
ncbi:MAG: HyaD/HybD family hydrogenase maturation endopeptidase [Nitrospirota bacterium]|jgi:hydrogenase maturation protease